jgi:HEAT repeat protein
MAELSRTPERSSESEGSRPSVSVVVRFKDEITHIDAVLRAVREQRTEFEVEVIGVDNRSVDGSREVAERYADRVIEVADYRPGTALNRAAAEARGDLVVALSAHAVPASSDWLASLTAHARNSDLIGVYGAQVYPVNSRFLDRRDLAIFSDPEPRIERVDSDFWNANSVFPLSRWRELPFDELVIELEDHHWTKRLLARGDLAVRYEPAAPVYHYGHETRNDRSTRLPEGETAESAVDRGVAVLRDRRSTWPERMSAGLLLGSLVGVPGVERAIAPLGDRLLHDEDFDVRWRMAAALGRLGSPDGVRFLLRGLGDSSFYVRDECAWSLARLGPVAAPEVAAAIGTIPSQSVPFAALALGLSGEARFVEQAVDVLVQNCLIGPPETRLDTLYFLGELPAHSLSAEVRKIVVSFLADRDQRCARAAAWTAGRFGAVGAQDPVTAGLVEALRWYPVDVVRAEAAAALGGLSAGGERPGNEVLRALRADGAGQVRYAALQSLRLNPATDAAALAAAVAELPSDPDNGVEFEKQLVLSGGHR